MKTARQPQVGVLFDHELAWGEFMNTIHDDYRDLNVRGLEFYSYKRHQALITEFIDAPLLTTPEHPHMDPDGVQRYVELLLATDEAGENWKPSIATSMSTTTFERLDHGWDGWIKKGRLIEDGIITKTELDLARQRMNSVHDIQPRMQHGDFVPWYIFDDDGTWIMYDAEHASPDFPRFYDLAYSYTRLLMLCDDPTLPNAIVRGFADAQPDADDFFRQFLPVVSSRSVGMLFDAQNDKAFNDYTDKAKRLFSRCLAADDLDALLSTD